MLLREDLPHVKTRVTYQPNRLSCGQRIYIRHSFSPRRSSILWSNTTNLTQRNQPGLDHGGVLSFDSCAAPADCGNNSSGANPVKKRMTPVPTTLERRYHFAALTIRRLRLPPALVQTKGNPTPHCSRSGHVMPKGTPPQLGEHRHTPGRSQSDALKQRFRMSGKAHGGEEPRGIDNYVVSTTPVIPSKTAGKPYRVNRVPTKVTGHTVLCALYD